MGAVHHLMRNDGEITRNRPALFSFIRGSSSLSRHIHLSGFLYSISGFENPIREKDYEGPLDYYEDDEPEADAGGRYMTEQASFYSAKSAASSAAVQHSPATYSDNNLSSDESEAEDQHFHKARPPVGAPSRSPAVPQRSPAYRPAAAPTPTQAGARPAPAAYNLSRPPAPRRAPQFLLADDPDFDMILSAIPVLVRGVSGGEREKKGVKSPNDGKKSQNFRQCQLIFAFATG